jgi:hypothetical protein
MARTNKLYAYNITFGGSRSDVHVSQGRWQSQQSHQAFLVHYPLGFPVELFITIIKITMTIWTALSKAL